MYAVIVCMCRDGRETRALLRFAVYIHELNAVLGRYRFRMHIIFIVQGTESTEKTYQTCDVMCIDY